jgi:hypothetical protein
MIRGGVPVGGVVRRHELGANWRVAERRGFLKEGSNCAPTSGRMDKIIPRGMQLRAARTHCLFES